MGDSHLVHLANTIKTFSIPLVELCLDDNRDISIAGLESLTLALSTSVILHTLSLKGIALDQKMLCCVCDLMKSNTSIRRLNLMKTSLWNVQDISPLGLAIQANKGVTELNLSCNRIDAAEVLDALKFNTHVTELDFADNVLSDKGMQVIADVLRCNRGITALDLQNNAFGPEGCLFFADALKVNRTLKWLDLSANFLIRDIGLSFLAQGLGAKYLYCTNPLAKNLVWSARLSCALPRPEIQCDFDAPGRLLKQSQWM